MTKPIEFTHEWAKEVEAAFQAGVAKEIAEHHAAGRPVWIMENGKLVRVDPPAADKPAPRKTAAR